MIAPSTEQFRDDIHEIVTDLDRHSIDYRVIGSVARAALGISPVNFAGRGVDDQPDIDMIVPRNDLKGAREVRKKFEGRTKVGLAIPTTRIDLRPTGKETESHLVWGRQRVPIDAHVFDPMNVTFDEVPLRSVNQETLRHIYGYMTPEGRAAEKYRLQMSQFDHSIGEDNEHSENDAYRAFHDYNVVINSAPTISQRTIEMFETATRGMSPQQRMRFKKLALGMASVIGWR